MQALGAPLTSLPVPCSPVSLSISFNFLFFFSASRVLFATAVLGVTMHHRQGIRGKLAHKRNFFFFLAHPIPSFLPS